MDVHDTPGNDDEPRRRLNFDDMDDFIGEDDFGGKEIEVQDIENENQMNCHDTTEGIHEIHTHVPKELIPEIGMEFETENAAYNFYNAYAKAVGFGTKLSRAHKDKLTGKVLDRLFCCSKEGQRWKDPRDVNVISHRPITRCNCLAAMKISCRQTDIHGTNKYQIVKFVAEHNHDCATPSKSHLFRSHRKMSAAQKHEVDLAISCGISQKHTMELMAKESGGLENLGFISDDCKNYLRTKRMLIIELGDTRGVLEYLQRKQIEDPQFYYAIQVDEDALIINIFWTDAKMRADYTHFGDVVCFDTTYRKYEDGRPIALFVGVNNHKQTPVFGAALLYDETTVTFSWLFDTFVTAICGKRPQTILTEQCQAMTNALASQWPETYHRLCVWHIYQNAAQHLKEYFKTYKDEFAKEFNRCIYGFEEEEDFIGAWN